MTIYHTTCTNPSASRFIRNFWQLHGQPLYQSETILAKGVVELIFSFEEPVVYNPSDLSKKICTPRCFVNGISHLPAQIAVPQNQFFFGVVLRPAAVKKLLKAPSGAFVNSVTDLEDVQKDFASLWHQLAAATGFEERISIVQNRINTLRKEVYEQELAISDYLNHPAESSTVAELAYRFSYSSRQLNRKSQELFGMPTETMLRYKRYLHALQLIHHTDENFTGIAYASGYFDQAHFNREFRDFTRLTPGDYRKQKSQVPGHLFKDVRYVQ